MTFEPTEGSMFNFLQSRRRANESLIGDFTQSKSFRR